MKKQIKTNKSKFATWFKSQFGRLPDINKSIKLKNDIGELQYKLRQLEKQYRDEEILQEQHRAALYFYTKESYEKTN